MKSKAIWWTIGVFAALATASVVGLKLWLDRENRPLPDGKAIFVRFERGTGSLPGYRELEKRGVIRNASALQLYARLSGRAAGIRAGTYEVAPGQSAAEVLKALERPISLSITIREGLWIKRVARRLEEAQICRADEYEALAKEPERFQNEVSVPLPKTSLEGYLFPDTYELAPLAGAEAVIRRQLRAFEQKVVPKIPAGANLARLLTVGSLIEAEVAQRTERRVVAGVIENRLRKKMRLELDATVLYALQEWKTLGPGVVKTVKSPYNTYLNAGLPPGPICSPGLDSILAAADPQANSYLFYVAKPDRFHLFATTYEAHLANIRRARAMKPR